MTTIRTLIVALMLSALAAGTASAKQEASWTRAATICASRVKAAFPDFDFFVAPDGRISEKGAVANEIEEDFMFGRCMAEFGQQAESSERHTNK